MKKIFTFALAAMTAVSFVGWGTLNASAATTYTAQQVATHNTVSDCWLIISGQVYDVTNFIPIHPGGNAIVPYCGTDATTVFNSIHNQSAFALLPTYLIGSLATALAAPTGLVGTPTQTTVALSWTAATGGVAPITYTVFRNGTSTGSTASTTFTDTGLTTSTAYTYVIQATDSATPAATASSSQISVTTLAPGVTSTPLTAPTGLVGTPATTSIALSWTAATGGVAPITYTILRNGNSVATTTGTTFNNTGLTSSITYTFVVKATDSATPAPASMSSSQISVTTLGSTVTGGGGENEMENEIENENVSTSTHQTGGGENEGGHVSTSTPSTGGSDDGGHVHISTSTTQTEGGGTTEQEHRSSTSGSTSTNTSSSGTTSHTSGRHGGDN